ncbi:hypothetical protein [Pseudaeromonas paramecii]|uniref:Uncharacterized protein n=1 Tax=Pseudaeromonas paramecii TaxID=2138166 RepID=A0ABP8PUT0_9GAMM
MPLKGFKDLEKNLKQIEKNAKELDGTHHMSLADLFSPTFMNKHTQYVDFQSFIDESKIEITTADDLENNQEWELFVSQNTPFSSWAAMRDEALAAYAADRLFSGLK